ncbi:MAG: chemotaxis protein CheW, partial [Deltaproteobacteria bacterium]|nr:chemotaxis protein CheW [Deltaproteobacteria bacterium]
GAEIEPPSTYVAKVHTEYILGMAKIEGGVKILLDIDRVSGEEELDLIKKIA